jgi:hypothetical protein
VTNCEFLGGGLKMAAFFVCGIICCIVGELMKTMMAALLLVVLVRPACAQEPKPAAPAGTRIGTATRLVVLFHDLERQLMAAQQKHDQAALDRLLAPDFEVWTPDPPGEPISRVNWLQKLNTSGAPDAFSIRQMAVRGLDDHTIASFVLLKSAGGRQSADFVVDVWARSGSDWKLAERYLSQVPAAQYAGERKPTGKE